jgi:microcystin-dependent protein
MSTPYIGEIRIFAGNFAPAGWLFCEGQLIPISENDALFVVIGTTYGGDGQSTFALPDLRGRLPIHSGQGPGLSSHTLGETGGVESATLTTNQIPPHQHTPTCLNKPGTASSPVSNVWAAARTGTSAYTAPPNPYQLQMHPQAIGAPLGGAGNQPHTNLGPYLCVNFIISLFGILPTPT